MSDYSTELRSEETAAVGGELTPVSRCLILGCTKAKREDAGRLPAIERYDGPTFRVLRKFLSEAPCDLRDVDVLVLSARHGMIPGNRAIDDYDQKMTVARARTIRPQTLEVLERVLRNGYQEVFVSLSRMYLQAIEGFEALLPDGTDVFISQSAMGKRLRELKRWLYQLPAGAVGSQGEASKVCVTGQATLRGQEIEATAEEAEALAQEALVSGCGEPYNFRSWYGLVDEAKVSTKWWVSLLSGLSVSEFQSSEARRVLKQLGIEVYRDD